MIPSTFKNVRKALANLKRGDVRAAPERIVIVGLTASRGERFMAMESFLAPPNLSQEERVEALRHIYRTNIPGAP